MTLSLSSTDIARLGTAAEALLSAPADPDPWTWWRKTEDRVRPLFPGANIMLSAADTGRLRNESATVDPSARRRMAELGAADPRTGAFIVHDPVIEAWIAYRRRNRMELWSTAGNQRIIESMGLDLRRSVFYNEGLLGAQMYEMKGLSSLSAAGEGFLQVGYPQGGRSRFGDDDLSVLALLLPAFRAGWHALGQLQLRRGALAATIDAGAEPVLVVGADGRELHRSAALRRVLAHEPARERVVEAMTRAARSLREHADRRRSPIVAPVPGAEHATVTPRARYVARATYAPAAAWGAEGVVLVSLESSADAPAGAPLASGGLAARLGLTAREADVARLLAERLRNRELAQALGISEHTAKRHTENVMRKLGVHSRTELAMRLRDAASAPAPAGT